MTSSILEYFEFINVDRREVIGQGKLCEGFYSDNGIEQLLSRLPLRWADDIPSGGSRRPNCIGPWAGHRLITVGEYAGTCPAGMLTEAEETELGVRDGDYYVGLFYACETFCLPPSICSEPLMAPSGQTLVLRNLSKRLYVRAVEFEDYQHRKVQSICGFGPLVKINTAWSDSVHDLPYEPLIPGPWAGDRFDITTLESMDLELWQDVTEQQAEKMVQILEADGCVGKGRWPWSWWET